MAAASHGGKCRERSDFIAPGYEAFLPADGWYEFRIDAAPEYTWTVATSHGAAGRSLIPAICRVLKVIAFDGQANRLLPGEES